MKKYKFFRNNMHIYREENALTYKKMEAYFSNQMFYKELGLCPRDACSLSSASERSPVRLCPGIIGHTE